MSLALFLCTLFDLLIVFSYGNHGLAKHHSGITVDPCDDFNEYVCGRSPNENFISIFDMMNANMYRTIAAELKKSESPESRKAKRFYDSCRSIRRIKRQSTSPIIKWKTSFLAKLNKFNAIRDNAERFKKKLSFVKINPPFHHIMIISSEINTYNTSQIIPQIGKPNFYLINTFANEINKKAFEEKVLAQVKAMVYLGALLDDRISMQDVFKMIKFEITLYKIWMDSSNIALANKTIGEISSRCSVVDTNIISHIYQNIGQIFIGENQLIQVTSPKALFRSCQAIKAYLKSEDGSKVLENYLKWSSILAASELIYDPVLRSLQKADVDNILKATTTRKKRSTDSRRLTASILSNPIWVQCLTLTDTIFPLSISSIYATTLKDPEFVTQEVRKMVESLKAQLKIKIYNSTWLSHMEKENIINKIDHIEVSVLYPKETLNQSYITRSYANLTIYEEKYFENMMQSSKYIYERNLQSLIDFDISRIFSSFEINAYYVYQQNEIVIPMGILQKSVIRANMTLVEKYNKLGFILAHEIMHGFDPLGINFDSYGNYKQILSLISRRKYERILLCYVDQYNSYNLPGYYELSENIADNNGLEIAIKAYEYESKTCNATEVERFFVGVSEMMCPTRIRDVKKRSLMTDPHSPNKYRVIGTMSNLAKFSEIYQCDRDSKMNPASKCTLW